ncbi:GtrA family protein [Egicoccus sp. AB-alg2]|uniref:GtrA family protein n=1 Tax=Egicoccus sp. AB-alg2 TaxID=3242693 RepID=UPI00359E0016
MSAGPRGVVHRLGELRRLVRYGVAGAASAATHLGVLFVLVEVVGVVPVAASTVGFLCSVAVSYTLQKRWVFASTTATRVALPRFLAVTGVGLLLNAGIMAAGTAWAQGHYALVQLVALVAIPISNYLLNSLWTFR